MSELTQKYSITMPRNIAEAAVARQIERDNLSELVAAAEAEHGPSTEEEIQAKRDQLRRAVIEGDDTPAIAAC